MDEIVKMEHVYQYNEMMGQETLHPLVSVIDFSKLPEGPARPVACTDSTASS